MLPIPEKVKFGELYGISIHNIEILRFEHGSLRTSDLPISSMNAMSHFYHDKN